MVQIVLIGLGAGAASALLFAAIASGTILSIVLFYLAPLPILIAALGWSHLAGLLAVCAATALVWAFAGRSSIAAPVIAFGAWWLGYLALLARPTTNGGGDVEWYPIGRLTLWAAGIGALLVAVMIVNFGTDQETLQAMLRKAYGRVIRDPAQLDLLVVVVPPAAAAFSTLVSLFNVWLAARIVKVSGRLARPWPDIPAMTLPPVAAGSLAILMAGSLLPDLAGILVGTVAASLLMVFTILGFAVLHAITRTINGRPFVLAAVYVATVVTGVPLFALSLLGLVEALFHIRARLSSGGRPPPPPSIPT